MADLAEAKTKADIDDFILAEPNSFRVSPISLDEPTPILADSYSEDSRKIAIYLTSLRRPPDMNTKRFNAFKKKAIKFIFCRNSKNVPMRRVVDDPIERQTILQQLHNESGHKGQEDTYRRFAD